MPATVVLVHGACHGAWCWDKVVAGLTERGIPCVAVDLPGHGDSREPLGDLAAGAAALRATLDGIDRSVVCGHSYGGAVITEGAAEHPGVRHLVYITAFALLPGESTMAAATDGSDSDTATELGQAMAFADDGTVTFQAPAVVDALYHDCTPADVEFALSRLGPERLDALGGVATRAAWQSIPSTYVVCTEDRGVAPSLQRRLAARTTTTVDWPTSHSPFLSRPDLVVDLLAGLAEGT
ncbi:MAG TPA: alpha/beta hydrolase [Acidimicrobiia bacterium]|nr:alpha/beta hydrolase [Acidimicrobiia bacterium]